MVPRRYGTLKGLELPVLVYESYEEADKAAASVSDPHPMLTVGNASLAYRGAHNEGREIICQMLESTPEVASKLDEDGKPLVRDRGPKKNSKGETVVKDGKEVQEVTESPYDYTSRVCKAMHWEDLTAFQAELDKRCGHMPVLDDDDNPVKDEAGNAIFAPLAVDIRERGRKTPEPKELPKKYKEAALGCLQKGKLDLFARDFKKRFDEKLELPTQSAEGVTYANDSAERVEALGKAMKRFEQASVQSYS